jgi:2-succinyl-5-enolpyruvyl-6-hydroxy-3-cyclohexene-1-carboxylate synthase
MSSATKLAHAVLRQLIEVGISDFVISPGSRNAPLLTALGEAAKNQIIDLHVKIDERGAAFFALGVSKASNNYVAVICTSGTAAANFHPAAIEALHGMNKLLIITADRPARLRKTGANQTTNQIDIFPGIKTHDLSSEIEVKSLLKTGPVHLNIQFDEPLVSNEKNDWLAGLKINPINFENRIEGKLNLTTGILVIGHDRAGYRVDEVMEFAKKLNWPVIAEDPISFPQAIAHAALFLSDNEIAKVLAPENVVVIGRTTLSRSINNFIKLAKNMVVIDPRSLDIDNKREANLLLSSLPVQIDSEKSDEGVWQKLSSLAAETIENLKWSEQFATSEITKSIPNGSALFVGSSRPVRDIEAFCKPRGGLEVFANRGLAGIDGNISTIFGVAKEFDTTYAILGDLTFLHDISALSNATDENVRIYVIDNNGGGIFSTLPQAGVENFDQLFGTPHNLDLVKVCAGFGINVVRVDTPSELQKVVSNAVKGLEIVIIDVPDRETNAKVLRDISQSISNAVRIGINLA